MIVTATREAQPLADTPNSVEVIDAEEIFERQGRTLPELLSETPSVMVQKTAHGQGSPFYPGVRIHRQQAHGSWTPAIVALRAALMPPTR